MSTSEKKIAANRANGKKSHGPTNATSTRFNATKHGLLAHGITELDDSEGYHKILADLLREKSPVGAIEVFLVKSAALDMVRWQRARRLEAEYITSELNPPLFEVNPLGNLDMLFEGTVSDPGIPAAISPESAHRLVGIFQRYESFFANRLFRTLHELERLQRTRQGERLPAPAAVDVNVHADAVAVGSASSEFGRRDALLDDGESLPALATVDVGVHSDGKTVDSTHNVVGDQEDPPHEEE
jgi:hypothetical protein